MLCPGGRARSDSTLSAAGFVLFEKGSLRLKEVLLGDLFYSFKISASNVLMKRDPGLTFLNSAMRWAWLRKANLGQFWRPFCKIWGTLVRYIAIMGPNSYLTRGDIYGINNKKTIITGTKILHGGYRWFDLQKKKILKCRMFHQLIRRGLLKRRAWARTLRLSALHAQTRLKQLPDGITLKKVHVVFARPPPTREAPLHGSHRGPHTPPHLSCSLLPHGHPRLAFVVAGIVTVIHSFSHSRGNPYTL